MTIFPWQTTAVAGVFPPFLTQKVIVGALVLGLVSGSAERLYLVAEHPGTVVKTERSLHVFQLLAGSLQLLAVKDADTRPQRTPDSPSLSPA